VFIYSNLATSLDGKIALASRKHVPIGTPFDREQMQGLRSESDAILMGASSLRAFRRPLLNRHASPAQGPQPLNIILSYSLEGVSASWPFFKSNAIKRLLILKTPPRGARLKSFEKTSQILVLKNSPPAPQIVAHLKQLGIHQLLVEGGGGVMWEFCRHNLIDEIHVTLTPKIIGGSASPTLVDGVGFNRDQILNLKLVQCRPVGDELYLIYRKTKRHGT